MTRFILKIFFIIFLPISGLSQEKEKYISAIAFSFNMEGHGMANHAFDELNELFELNDIPILEDQLGAVGLAIRVFGKKKKSGFEIDLLYLNSALGSSSTPTPQNLLPLLTGNTIRLSYFRTYLEKKRWYGTYAFGCSFAKLSLLMIETERQINPFETLIQKPELSSSLNLSQKKRDIGLQAYGSIYFRTRALKSFCNDFDIGFKLGYYQPLIRGGKWRVTGSDNNFIDEDISPIKLEHAFTQLSLLVSFDAH